SKRSGTSSLVHIGLALPGPRVLPPRLLLFCLPVLLSEPGNCFIEKTSESARSHSNHRAFNAVPNVQSFLLLVSCALAAVVFLPRSIAVICLASSSVFPASPSDPRGVTPTYNSRK